MRISVLTIFAASCCAPLLAPALTSAMGPPPPPAYNRSVAAEHISYAPSPDGAGMVISATIGIESTPDADRDLSFLVAVTVDDVVVGGEGGGGGTEIRIIHGPGIPDPIGGPANCLYWCRDNCRAGTWCGPTNPAMCMCISTDMVAPSDGGGIPVSILVAGLATGDVITVGVTPAPAEPGGVDPLPEVYTLDDVASVVVALPACPADFDGSGSRDVPDIFAFLSAWFAQEPSADFDGVTGITVPDIFAFLSAWFAGCP